MPSIFKIFRQATANSIKMYPLDAPVAPQFNSTPFDYDWFKNQFSNNENRSDYYQKYQIGDITSMQFHANGFFSNIKLRNCDGMEVAAMSLVTANYPGNTITHEGVEYPLNTATIDVIIPDIPEGIYYLTMDVDYDTVAPVGVDAEDKYISWPIYIAGNHPNTLLIQYTNTRNMENTIFAGLTYPYQLRVEGSVQEFVPKSDNTIYNNQTRNSTLLRSFPYRTFKLFIGEIIGISEDLWDKVNIALCCNRLVIDNTAYTRDESGDWEAQRDQRRIWASLTLKETVAFSGLTLVNRAPLIVFVIPPYPFAFHDAMLDNIYYDQVQIPIYNNADLNLLITLLNLNIPTVTGIFKIKGGAVIYEPGTGETFTQASAGVMTKKQRMVKIAPPTAHDHTMEVNTRDSALFIVWGDGGYAAFGDYSGYVSRFNSHLYTGGASNVNVDVFFFDTSIREIGIVNTHKINSVTGDVSDELEAFLLDAVDLSTFDVNFLTAAEDTLQTLSITNSNITSVTNLSHAWLALSSILLNANLLSTAAVNSILQELKQALDNNNWGTGILDLSGQSPAAPPSGAGITAAAALVGTYGWTVITD